jgi:S-adenosylmethionine-dependent methyltransferase
MHAAEMASGTTQTPTEEMNVRTYVRRQLVQRNLAATVLGDTGPKDIVDVGGGNGADAAWLARRGHRVTLLDPDPNQLVLARQRLARLDREVSGRVRLEQATAKEFLESGGRRNYDLALVHEVRMYVDHPNALARCAMQLVKHGGAVSFLEKGFGNTEARLVHANRQHALEGLRKTGRVTEDGRRVWTVKPPPFTQLLRKLGASSVEYYDICVTNDFDRRPISTVPPRTLSDIAEEQYRLGSDPKFRGTAPYIQFIAQIT